MARWVTAREPAELDHLVELGCVCLGTHPTLDDMVAHMLLSRHARGLPTSGLDSLVTYADDVRQGFRVDSVSPECTVEALYQAIVHEHLGPEHADERAFLAAVETLLELASDVLAAGRDFREHGEWAKHASLARYGASLRADRTAYEADLSQARRCCGVLPAEHAHARVATEFDLLVLRRPRAALFALWARADEGAPNGQGYGVLLVEGTDGELVLSSDPVRRLPLAWLAGMLSEREPDDRQWYDGARHRGTLIASPRPLGSVLGLEGVVGVLREAVRLRDASRSAPRLRVGRRTLAVAAGVVVALSVPLVLYMAREAESARDLSADEVAAIRDRFAKDDETGVARYAVVAGGCGYLQGHALASPCRDARAVRDLLVEHYGYDPRNVRLLVDGEGTAPEDHPTAPNIRRAIELLAQQRRPSSDSAFLFYYSGHGVHVQGAQTQYGMLAPLGYFEREGDASEGDRGWDMGDVLRELRRHVRSDHLMVIVDACASGWATHVPGPRPRARGVSSAWGDPAHVVISASRTTESASAAPNETQWDGLSVMTYAMVRALTPDPTRGLRADANEDGVVTHIELGQHLAERVPALVSHYSPGSHQTPTFANLAHGEGQFLWVPVSGERPAGAGGSGPDTE